jgi:hypothetical protein
MMIVALMAAQFLGTPLPREMEATLDPYTACVHRRFVADIERLVAANAVASSDSSEIMNGAIAACVGERGRAISLSEQALESVRGFEDADARRAFVREKFDSLDELFRWSITPEGDPDNWTPDAED